jgi:hypothetical protein
VENGKFVVDKWAKPLGWVLNNRPKFLSHMPYSKGWTIVHLRAASHGNNSQENTHPFIIGPWAFIHNGIWTEHNMVRLALSKMVQMKGETDSEVAGNFWNIIGPKKFAEVVEYSGVFMGLHKNGNLWVAKTSGDLEIKALPHKQILLASELNPVSYEGKVDGLNGWYHFSPEGKHIKNKENVSRWATSYPYRGGMCGATATSHPHASISDHTDYPGYGQHISCDYRD